jgi:hypothetical protein
MLMLQSYEITLTVTILGVAQRLVQLKQYLVLKGMLRFKPARTCQ